MGSRIYDFLTDSFLFDESLIREEFRSVPDTEIQKELQRYREFCLSVTSELQREILSETSALKVFSGIKEVEINLLKQSALYTHQHIVADPLFALTETRTEASRVFNKFLGLKDSNLDKGQVARVVSYLKALTPMVAANYVKLLPTSYFFEAPKEIPFTYSETGFAERVPETLLKFFHDKAIVWTGKKDENGIAFDGKFEPGRIISIHFDGHGFEDSCGYALNDMQILERDDESGLAKFRMYMPEDPPDEVRFTAWVLQSINQTAGHVYNRVLIENAFSSNSGASYLTSSPFIFDLLKQIVPVNEDITTNSANAVLNMDLPFLDEIDIEVLMKIRSEDGEAFENFRRELDKQLREMRQITDTELLQTKRENVIHELSEVQVPLLANKISLLRKKSFAETSVMVGSLYGAVQTGGWTLPVAFAFSGSKSIIDYKKEVRENSAFFLWKVLRQSKKSH